MEKETLIPHIGVVTDIRQDTPDVKTFRVNALEGGKVFEHIPGQCAMLSIPGAGEGMFSITSSPTNEEYMEFSIKKCGCLTTWLHQMDVGQEIAIRGPYGNGFPVDTDFAGKDLLFRDKLIRIDFFTIEGQRLFLGFTDRATEDELIRLCNLACSIDDETKSEG